LSVLVTWVLPPSAGVDRVEETFRHEAPSAVKRELNAIHRVRLTGDDLIGALEEIYAKYRLAEDRREEDQRRRRVEVERAPRMVCSEAMV